MTNLVIQEIEKKFISKKVPMLRAGYQVRVHQKIKEGEKERIQVFEGLVINLNAGHGSSKTFTVRKVVQGIGVEKVFPIYSNRIAKIEIKKTFGVRRAKLNFLKTGSGMSKRLSAKLGLIERDAAHKKKKGLHEEEMPEVEEKVETVAEETAETAAPEAVVEEVKVEKEEAKAPVEEVKAEDVKAPTEEPEKEEAADAPADAPEDAPAKEETPAEPEEKKE